MTNVALLNYAYGVPVKLYATMITVSAAVLVLYDARRLFDFFVRDRATSRSLESTVLQDRVPSPWRWTIKAAAVGSVSLSSFVAMAPTLHRPQPSPIEGAWSVVTTDSSTSWRRLTVDSFGATIRTRADSTVRCTRASGGDATMLTLKCSRGRSGAFRWTRSQDTLYLDGTFAAAPIHAIATSIDRSSYPLFRSKFRWIME
jgi:hypothetical protein